MILEHVTVDAFISLRLSCRSLHSATSATCSTSLPEIAANTYHSAPRLCFDVLQTGKHHLEWLQDIHLKYIATMFVDRLSLERLRAMHPGVRSH